MSAATAAAAPGTICAASRSAVGYTACSRSLPCPVQASAEYVHGRKSRRRAYERILRYPGGKERRIRYPATDEVDVEPWNPYSSYEEDWDFDRWSAHSMWAAEAASSAGPAPQTAESASPPQQQGMPGTAGDLVQYLSSDDYKKAQQEQWQQLRGMYQVLQSSPWVQSRPLHIIALLDPGSETAMTYTLRTRIQRSTGSELDLLLGGRKGANGRSVLHTSDMREGIIAFDDESDAERYRTLLQAETDAQVVPFQYDAHSLMREAQAARAVLVWFPKSQQDSPALTPTMLAASLNRQKPFDE
ncbi:hypothetical protein WJX73_004072 [Symbiochloris irregularis]|uniref:Uncharacterized protein n=1 Tax=Symbiochloris irregularis TaxID=706552 RepID=A0AAW1P1V7_9CHLO